MPTLTASFVREEYSACGPQGWVVLLEPNGDEFECRCLARPEGKVEIYGDSHTIAYLESRYGRAAVALTAQKAVLDHFRGQ